MACLREDEENRSDFKRTEIKNISKITGIPILGVHFLIYDFLYYSTIHIDYKKSLKKKKAYYKNNLELMFAIDNEDIKEFKEIKEKYQAYIKARLGYSDRYIEKQKYKHSKKNYDKTKNTNQY